MNFKLHLVTTFSTKMASSALNGQAEGLKLFQKASIPFYDPDITARVIAATGPAAHPRLAEIMPSLLRHLHDFAREVHLTTDEWMAAVDMVCLPLDPPFYS